MIKKRISVEDKRVYIEWFFKKFVSDSEFNCAYVKGFGPWSSVLQVTEIFSDAEPVVSDMYFDLGLYPGKVHFYPEESVNRLYFTLRLIELNRHIRVIGYVLYVIRWLKDRFLSWWS